MAKKKHTVTKTTSSPAKQIPDMFPLPAPVKLEKPLKIVAVDPETGTFICEGSPSPDLLAAAEIERRRMNLIERLRGYKETCLHRMKSHWGKRPKHIQPSQWNDMNARFRLIPTLQWPDNLPAKARHALEALQTLLKLDEELQNSNSLSGPIQRAICLAIDFGQLLQRGQTQIDHGATVDIGKRNAVGRAKAKVVKLTKTDGRIEAAHTEYQQRMATIKTPRMKTATLQNMSEMMDSSGNQIGKFGTLRRWANNW